MKNNIFNRVFQPKRLKEFKELLQHHKAIVGWFPQLEQDLEEAKTLENLVDVHKKAWQLGYQSENIGPCPWGMFRTNSIPEMKPEEVYLGGIWGLVTKPIPFWNEHSNETMAGNGFGIDDNKKIYDLVLSQYRNHLRSNFVAMKNSSRAWLEKNS